MYWWYTCGILWDTYCFRVYTLNCTLGIVYSLFFSCNCTQCRGLGTNTCLYFHYCNLILVNHFVQAHHVGLYGAATSAPVSSWFRSSNSQPAFVRVRGPTRNRGLPDGREERALQRMELMMATTGGRWGVFSGPNEEEHSLGCHGYQKEDIHSPQCGRWRRHLRPTVTDYFTANTYDKIDAGETNGRGRDKTVNSLECAARAFRVVQLCCGWWKAVQGTLVGHCAARWNSDGGTRWE